MSKATNLDKRLNDVFCEVFEDDEIQVNDMTTASDIADWDSLTHIVLVLAVEKEFGLRLSAAEVSKLENVGAMKKILAERATR